MSNDVKTRTLNDYPRGRELICRETSVEWDREKEKFRNT